MSSHQGLQSDSADNHYGYKKDFRTALPQVLAVSAKNILLLGYGMTLGFSTILIPAMQSPVEGETLHLNDNQISWISSINYIVVPLGCALSGVVTTPIGRKRAMQLVNVPFLVAWLLFHYASNVSYLYGALFLTGLAGGLLEAPVLTYVAEITQPHLRGALAATSTMCILIGIFMQFLFGIFLYWRTVALVNITFTIFAVIALCFVPESPHWLVSKERRDEAVKDLSARLVEVCGGPRAGSYLGQRMSLAIQRGNAASILVGSNDDKMSFKEQTSLYLDKSFLTPFFLVSYTFFVGHFSGMTTLQTYSVSIFQALEAPIDKYYATLIIGILQILGSVSCVMLVHYTGKRPLTFISTIGPGLCCLLVAAYDGYLIKYGIPGSNGDNVLESTKNVTINLGQAINSTQETINQLENPYSWIPTTLMMLLAFLSHCGIRMLPWILIGEVFSAKTRAGGAGLASAVGYIFGFLTNKIYLSLVHNLSIWGTYGMYGIISLSGTVILYYILPETEGKKLNDIESHFSGIKRLTNDVHRPKKTSKEVSKLQDLNGKSNLAFEANTEKY